MAVLSQSTKRAIAYGSTSFASAAMHNIFITYYIHFFLETYTLDDSWFYVGEVVFMLWNSFNDPWFGWLIDSTPSKNRLLSRIPIIRYGGLFWCISFTLIFFPLLSSQTYLGLHFIITLCLYDGMLSLVMLCHGSLLADITNDTKERAKCNMYSSIFCVLGSSSVLISQLFWDKHSIFPFQLFVFSLSVICFISFNVTATSLSSHLSSSPSLYSSPSSYSSSSSSSYSSSSSSSYSSSSYSSSSSKHAKDKEEEEEEEWRGGNGNGNGNGDVNNNNNNNNNKKKKGMNMVNRMINEKPSLPPNFMHFVKEIFLLRNFVLFVIINLIQVFNCHFNSNFMSITMEKLLMLDASSKRLASLLVTIPSLAPHLIVIACTPIVKQRGLHFLLNILFFIKFFFSLSLLVFGSSESWYLILFFILLNKSFSEAICRHGNLVLADIVDEDRVVYGRSSSYSSLIFGVNALFTKPGQSLAPILGWTVLRIYVGDREGEYIFFMLCMVPFICSILQLYLWNIFTLKGFYLRDIKRQLENLEHYV